MLKVFGNVKDHKIIDRKLRDALIEIFTIAVQDFTVTRREYLDVNGNPVYIIEGSEGYHKRTNATSYCNIARNPKERKNVTFIDLMEIKHVF